VLSRSPCGTKNDHRRARCAVHQQSQDMTLTLREQVLVLPGSFDPLRL
jgi:hypothetical protein